VADVSGASCSVILPLTAREPEPLERSPSLGNASCQSLVQVPHSQPSLDLIATTTCSEPPAGMLSKVSASGVPLSEAGIFPVCTQLTPPRYCTMT
jgi:hypothetical protein